MIRITVELVPFGVGKPVHLGTAVIANDGSSEDRVNVGNYDVALSKWGKPTVAWKKGRVEGFRRKKRGPWDLLYLALKSTVGDRNGEPKQPALQDRETVGSTRRDP